MVLKFTISLFSLPDFHSTKRTTNHITPVYEEKLSSCQLIYIHEEYTPIFKCFTAMNFTL